jgi:hypothetical protein
MATIKGVLARFSTSEGDAGKDAVLAVQQYAARDWTDKDDLARYARAVSRALGSMAQELERQDGDVPNVAPAGQSGYACPVGDGTISADSHQADPCAHCSRVYHDRCFYTTAHSCVKAGLVDERPGYGTEEGREAERKRLLGLRRALRNQ